MWEQRAQRKIAARLYVIRIIRAIERNLFFADSHMNLPRWLGGPRAAQRELNSPDRATQRVAWTLPVSCPYRFSLFSWIYLCVYEMQIF